MTFLTFIANTILPTNVFLFPLHSTVDWLSTIFWRSGKQRWYPSIQPDPVTRDSWIFLFGLDLLHHSSHNFKNHHFAKVKRFLSVFIVAIHQLAGNKTTNTNCVEHSFLSVVFSYRASIFLSWKCKCYHLLLFFYSYTYSQQHRRMHWLVCY